MQIPLSYADAVIGSAGSSISYIRRTSGATVTIQETRGVPGEMTVEISGTASQVQTAQQLIQVKCLAFGEVLAFILCQMFQLLMAPLFGLVSRLSWCNGVSINKVPLQPRTFYLVVDRVTTVVQLRRDGRCCYISF